MMTLSVLKIDLKELKNIRQTVDVIIITLPGIEKKEFSEIQEITGSFFRKLK